MSSKGNFLEMHGSILVQFQLFQKLPAFRSKRTREIQRRNK